jgi:Holliday junction resolvasome RuvABC endonuclease subunit
MIAALAADFPDCLALEEQLLARQPESTTEAASIFAVATSYQHGDVDEYLHPLAREAVRRCAKFLTPPAAIAEHHGLTAA